MCSSDLLAKILDQAVQEAGVSSVIPEETSLSTGDWIKIAPAAKRQFFASDISGITYICIQVKENSLEHFTAEDAVIG